MTYGELKDQTRMLLTSDNSLPQDDTKIKASIRTAFTEMADMATPLKWLTMNKGENILRLATGDFFIRKPDLPKVDTDVMDIDSELVPAVARMIASYVAKEVSTKQYHRRLAEELMKRYDAKTRAFMLRQEQLGEYDSVLVDANGYPVC